MPRAIAAEDAIVAALLAHADTLAGRELAIFTVENAASALRYHVGGAEAARILRELADLYRPERSAARG